MRLKQIAILIVLIGMAGIAAANSDPCPEKNAWNNKQTSDKLTVVSSHNSGNVFKYSISGIKETGKNNGVLKLCIDSSESPESESVASGISWSVSHPSDGKNFDEQFTQNGDNSDIPFDGKLYEVGSVEWHKTPDTEETLAQIHDDEECKRLYSRGDPHSNEEGSCFVKISHPCPALPELSPLILTSAGLLGIVLVSRKNKSG